MNGNLQGTNFERNKMLFLPDAKPELGPMHLFGIHVVSPLPLNFSQMEVYFRKRKIGFVEQIIIILVTGRDFQNSATFK